MNEVILYSQEHAIDFGADFNINALDLKLKRPHESRLHTRLLCFGDGGHKKCENFRIARAAFIFIRFTFFILERDETRRDETRRDETKCSGYTAAGTGHAVPIGGRILFQLAHISANEFYENSFCSFN